MPPSEPLAELSQGARRVLEAVREMVIPDCEVHPSVLLRAVRDDGSRGAEILEAHVSPADFERDLAWLIDTHESAGDDYLGRVLTEARVAARMLGRQQEIGTEHLLAGVMLSTPELARRWEGRGFSVERVLGSRVARESGSHAAIDVEPDLHLVVAPVAESGAAARIMDAAANRCREGLRVVEDFARFTLDDPLLTESLKGIRHELAETLTMLGADDWIRFRDTPGDVGTSISTASERVRPSLDSLVQANCKRVEESLRTLEEFGKLQHPRAAARIESLRYRFYTVEQNLAARRAVGDRLGDARLYLLLTDRLCPNGVGPVAQGSLAGGVDVIQLREKDMNDQRRLTLAKAVREWARSAGKLFIVNDRPDLAALVDADGVHLGQDDLPVAAARRIVGSKALIGVSTHSIEQARRAIGEGADYLGVGPVFASTTKEFSDFAGLEFVRQAASEVRLPWFAIGGISTGNLPQVQEAGATRVAVSSAICGAENPQGAARALAGALTGR
ncbi:Thiamine-phosphate synthase [Caulifigura coniformis]|uniref:Thiamine-phosphate synthase n=1 Tax=Caulifigura coniformis TaxID=2527983 RepID=A0A517SMT5_9PLAN|nr:thiamine phosphate synthase [Caulifigura coniformis]QDT57433.1 Thiamine-phosphate synthase [Caulifigura coniformis]